VWDAPRDVEQGGKPRGEMERTTMETVSGASALLGTVESRWRMASPRGSKQCHTAGPRLSPFSLFRLVERDGSNPRQHEVTTS
jgi:hypothetical protein